MPTRPLFRRAAAATALVTVALLLAACGGTGPSEEAAGASGGSSAAPLPVPVDKALAAQVPAAVAAAGALTVGTDPSHPPNEYLGPDGSTAVGFDVDLFTLVAAKLGLRARFTSAPFDSILPAVASGRFAVGVSSVTITTAREAQANMVSYFSTGTRWMTQQHNPRHVDPGNACGARVAVQTGTVQADDVTTRSAACAAAGKPPITIDQYAGQNDATYAVLTGKDDAGLADAPVVAWAVAASPGRLQVLGDVYATAPYGYVVPRDQTPLAQAIAGAVRDLIEDGTYQRVLANWGVQDGAIADPTVNPRAPF